MTRRPKPGHAISPAHIKVDIAIFVGALKDGAYVGYNWVAAAKLSQVHFNTPEATRNRVKHIVDHVGLTLIKKLPEAIDRWHSRGLVVRTNAPLSWPELEWRMSL